MTRHTALKDFSSVFGPETFPQPNQTKPKQAAWIDGSEQFIAILTNKAMEWTRPSQKKYVVGRKLSFARREVPTHWEISCFLDRRILLSPRSMRTQPFNDRRDRRSFSGDYPSFVIMMVSKPLEKSIQLNCSFKASLTAQSTKFAFETISLPIRCIRVANLIGDQKIG